MPHIKEVPGEEVAPPQPTFFLRIRTIVLSCIIFLSFLWIILFCVITFLQWDLLDHVERSLILIMLLVDTITLIMLPILLLQPFRPWLDAARVLFILLTHGGIATLFAARSPSFKCIPSKTSLNQEYVCSTIIIFVNIFNWIIPVLTIIYGGGLGILVRRLSKPQAQDTIVEDVEKQLPSPQPIRASRTTRTHDSVQSQHTLNSILEAPRTNRTTRSHNSLQNHTFSSTHEARLYTYAI